MLSGAGVDVSSKGCLVRGYLAAGFVPLLRSEPRRDSASNQNGAPKLTANAVSAQPNSLKATSYQWNGSPALLVQHALALIGLEQPAA